LGNNRGNILQAGYPLCQPTTSVETLEESDVKTPTAIREYYQLTSSLTDSPNDS